MKRQRNAAMAVLANRDPISKDSTFGKRKKTRATTTTAPPVEIAAKKDDVVAVVAVVTPAPAPEVVVAPEPEESEGLLGWEENWWWPWLSGVVVDEQMSWGAFWLPFWDVENGEDFSHSLFSDVFWDDDIWGLRGF
ncbi:uncharacterized protein LOC115714528 [Cannabis sativa]|uniref:uncharacterized protein LOC115714528 n=1 Tax=Cannabis sativa TaxID=3483 RepID=UPI0029C9F7F2|nr:uncharacterized protein LOC115714528 [Cannabis sativa]